MDRDKCLYFKDGYKYWVNRHYHIKVNIFPKELICVFYETDDICGVTVKIPIITLDTLGNLTIHPSYVWDGASGPTYDTLNSMIGSLVHDVIYQLIREDYLGIEYKEYADQLLHDICAEDGMFEWRADVWRWAVTTFGRSACEPSSEHLEKLAP